MRQNSFCNAVFNVTLSVTAASMLCAITAPASLAVPSAAAPIAIPTFYAVASNALFNVGRG